MVRPGASLVEVAVALVLAGIGMTAVAATTVTAVRTSGAASTSASAVAYARTLLDSLLVQPMVVPGSARSDRHAADWLVEGQETGHTVVALRIVTRGGRDTLHFSAVAAPGPERID